jgi:hypothetical protein
VTVWLVAAPFLVVEAVIVHRVLVRHEDRLSAWLNRLAVKLRSARGER